MPLRKNYSTQIEDLDALKRIAATLGLVQTRGQHRGEGSIRRLLEAIASGDVRLVPANPAERTQEPLDRAVEVMAEAGIIERGERDYPFPPVTPGVIEGGPLSEQVIAERR
jgi:hypothetical protein